MLHWRGLDEKCTTLAPAPPAGIHFLLQFKDADACRLYHHIIRTPAGSRNQLLYRYSVHLCPPSHFSPCLAAFFLSHEKSYIQETWHPHYVKHLSPSLHRMSPIVSPSIPNTWGMTTKAIHRTADRIFIMRRYRTKMNSVAVDEPSSPWKEFWHYIGTNNILGDVDPTSSRRRANQR